MKVGVVGQLLFSGGAEQWTLQLARHCDPAWVDWAGFAFVYGDNISGPMEAALAAFAPCSYGPEAIRELCDRSDVILVWGVPDVFGRGVLPRRAARRCRIVLTSHGDAVMDYTRAVLREPDEADLIVGVTRAAVECVPERARGWTRVIANMADPARVLNSASLGRAEVHARWGVPPGCRVLGFLGRKSPEKRPERLPDAIRALHDRGEPDWVGVHVGEGFHVDELHRHARTVATGAVYYPGVEWDVANVFRGFDWLLVPSRTEGSSLAVLEAMLAGVPVLSTPVGLALDRPELVRILPADPSGDDIASALLSDLADPATTAARVAHARRAMRELSTPERFGRDWTEAIRDAMAVTPPAPRGESLDRAGRRGL